VSDIFAMSHGHSEYSILQYNKENKPYT